MHWLPLAGLPLRSVQVDDEVGGAVAAAGRNQVLEQVRAASAGERAGASDDGVPADPAHAEERAAVELEGVQLDAVAAARQHDRVEAAGGTTAQIDQHALPLEAGGPPGDARSGIRISDAEPWSTELEPSSGLIRCPDWF